MNMFEVSNILLYHRHRGNFGEIMSGLFGYLGHRKCLPILGQALKLMYDFAYDSGGVLLKKEDNFYVKKILGSQDELERGISSYEGSESIGGVHLRWATHGQVSQNNVHPIFSCDGKVAVMHKGLISNFRQLKDLLIKEGHEFKTETDSEVIAHLVEKYYDGDLPTAVRRALLEVDGTYGLLVFYMDKKKEMVAANAGMGMMIGVGSNEYWVSMNKSVMYPFTDKVVYLNDGEMAHITPEGFMTSVIAGGSINVVNKYVETLKQSTAGIDEYFSRIEKEIFEQPEMVSNIIAGRLNYHRASTHFGGLGGYIDLFRRIKRLVFIGSGSSYYAALMAKELVENTIPISVSSYSAGEFIDKKFALLDIDHTAVFVISQSGGTSDTIAALNELNQMGVPTFGITNTVGSKVAKQTVAGIFLHSGPTLGMPSTKSFLSQLIAIIMLNVYLGRMHGLTPGVATDTLRELENLPNNIKKVIGSSYVFKQLVKRYVDYSDYLIVGSKYCYPTAKEAALLMSEMSDVRADCVDYGELKHGMINRINQNTIVLFMLSGSGYTYNSGLKLLAELKNRRAKVIGFLSKSDSWRDIEDLFDETVVVSEAHNSIKPILFLVAIQLWAFYLGKEKNLTPIATNSQVIPDDDFFDLPINNLD